MNFFSALHTSASGMAAERLRVDIASSNLANAQSTRGEDGGPYKRRDPIFSPILSDAIGDGVEGASKAAVGVSLDEIYVDESPGQRVYLPSHPDADAGGYVIMPNINPINEVVNLSSASRGYEANATSFETIKTMAQRALEIMR